jgi:hypothetical protein
MKIIAFDYLNIPRMNILALQFLQQWNNGQSETPVLMEPAVLARKEPLFSEFPRLDDPRLAVFSLVTHSKATASWQTAVTKTHINY